MSKKTRSNPNHRLNDRPRDRPMRSEFFVKYHIARKPRRGHALVATKLWSDESNSRFEIDDSPDIPLCRNGIA